MAEPWLRGTLMDFDSVRRQVLHSLELAAEDVNRWCAGLTDLQMHMTPENCASVAFHLRHISGSLDRLLTYGEGRQLSALQLEKLGEENQPLGNVADVLDDFRSGLREAAERVRFFLPQTYEEQRFVGRERVPSTVGALLIHCAEHTQRHVGQAITTARIVAALPVIPILA
jgi:uncharacterized damage-inducible protein DinB